MAAEQTALYIPEHVLEYLGEQKTLTLATASASGVPRATTLTYTNDGPTFYVWTHPETTTARHIAENPIAAFAIDEYASDWSKTKGVQATGDCRVVLGPAEIRRAVHLFSEKFPQIEDRTPTNISFFRIEVRDLAFIDNERAGQLDQELGAEFKREVVYSVFRDLPAHQAEAVATKLGRLRVDTGEEIVRQGAPADRFFIIVEGEVEAVREDGGEERQLSRMGPGQFFGELAILLDSPRTATVRALTPVDLLVMERDTFDSLVGQSLGTTQQFAQLVKERLSRAGDAG